MKKYSITEYAKKIGKSREAVFYQIKKEKIHAKKNNDNKWEIFIEDKEKIKKEEKIEIEIENEILKERIKGLKTELENKEELIKAKNEIIEAERRSNISLLYNLENKRDNQKNLNNKSKKGFFKSLKFWN